MARMISPGAVAGAAGGVVAGGLLWAVRRASGPAPRPDRWLGVTVLGTAEQITPDGELPEPLRRFGDRIEVRMRPAPGDRGTELYARPTEPVPHAGLAERLAGADPLADLRRALREAKSIVECGAVMRPDAPPTTHPGPAGRVLAALDRRAQGAGVL